MFGISEALLDTTPAVGLWNDCTYFRQCSRAYQTMHGSVLVFLSLVS